MAERVREIGQAVGWSGSVVPLGSDRLPAHLKAPYEPRQDLVVNTRRIREELGFSEVHSRAEGLRRTIEWERSNPPATGEPGSAEYAAEDAALN